MSVEHDGGQTKMGRSTLSKEHGVDLRMANHTLDLLKQKLSIVGAPIGKHEADRARAEMLADIELVMRTIRQAVGR